jgi:hypothetical protein
MFIMVGAKEMEGSMPVVSPSRSGVNEENEKLPEAKRRDKAKQKRQKRRPTQPVSTSDVMEAKESLEGPEVNILTYIICYHTPCVDYHVKLLIFRLFLWFPNLLLCLPACMPLSACLYAPVCLSVWFVHPVCPECT